MLKIEFKKRKTILINEENLAMILIKALYLFSHF